MQDRISPTVNKFRILGDLPFVGSLFRREQKDRSKTELLIFMTRTWRCVLAN